jgi:hypothetical protein
VRRVFGCKTTEILIRKPVRLERSREEDRLENKKQQRRGGREIQQQKRRKKRRKKTETQRDTREKKKKDHRPDLFATATPPPSFLFDADGIAIARP